jgi:plastocyanin
MVMKPIRSCTGLAVLLFVSGCGGSDTGANPPPGPDPDAITVAKAPSASGDAQTGVAGTALTSPIRVRVTQGGVAHGGTAVTWAAAGTGAGVSPASSTTDADGIASTTWTLPHGAGSATATATVATASGSPVNFSATVTAAAASQLALSSGNNQTAPAGSELPDPFRVVVRDGFGNPVAGTAVTWAVTAGNGSITPASSTTSASGIAQAVLTLGPDAGGNTATATGTGLSGSPVTFSATGTAIATTSDVEVGNDFFQPSTIQVPAGTTVTWTWTNTGSISHSVQSLGSTSFTSSSIMTGDGSTYSYTFHTPGTYQYNCAVHGNAMSGTVIVE